MNQRKAWSVWIPTKRRYCGSGGKLEWVCNRSFAQAYADVVPGAEVIESDHLIFLSNKSSYDSYAIGRVVTAFVGGEIVGKEKP